MTWKHKAICCDDCEQWYHINCQGIDNYMYDILNNSNLSWECANCGKAIFSTIFFNSTIETSHSFSTLDNQIENIDHTGKPSFFIITCTKTTKENIDHTGKPSFFIITCTKTTKESIDHTGKPSFFIITYTKTTRKI